MPVLADKAKVLALELGGLEAETSLLEGELCIDVTAADIMAHDLSSLHLGTSDTILMRWSEGEYIAKRGMGSTDCFRPARQPLVSPLSPTVQQPCCILCICPRIC